MNELKAVQIMSQNVSNMLDATMAKLKQMVDVNSVVGTPITTPDGTTIIPISKVGVGFGGGGSDFVSKHPNNLDNHPFGGGMAAGIQVTPIAFLILKEGSVRMLPVATAPNTTVDRLVDMVPETLDKIADFIDSHTQKKE